MAQEHSVLFAAFDPFGDNVTEWELERVRRICKQCTGASGRRAGYFRVPLQCRKW